MYIDYRYNTSDSISNRDFNFEIKEGLELPDNTVCYIGDISIPHTWTETYNNQLRIETTNISITNATAITLPNGHYTASSLAMKLTFLLKAPFPNIGFHVIIRNSKVGTIKLTNSSDSQFIILTDDTAVSLQGNDWYGDGGHHVYSPDINNLRSI